MKSLIEREDQITVQGVTVPYFVIDGGMAVLTEKGVDNLINGYFPQYPKNLLKNSRYFVQAGKFTGYLADIVKELSARANEPAITTQLEEAFAPLSYRGGNLLDKDLTEFNSILLKARDHHPKKKK